VLPFSLIRRFRKRRTTKVTLANSTPKRLPSYVDIMNVPAGNIAVKNRRFPHAPAFEKPPPLQVASRNLAVGPRSHSPKQIIKGVKERSQFTRENRLAAKADAAATAGKANVRIRASTPENV
jgi:hypothetical protein